MAVAAEVLNLHQQFEDIISQETWPSHRAILASELASEQLARQKAANFIGRVALEDNIEFEMAEKAKAPSISRNLAEAIQRAAKGDEEAYHMVHSNVASDVVERTLKSGHIIEVYLDIDENGEIIQLGQAVSDIQANSLRFMADNAPMLERTKAETRNKFRTDEILNAGLLEENILVTLSRAADDMSEEAMAEAGFFTKTMSSAMQGMTLESGRLKLESAFVAGKKNQDTERSDAEAFAKLGDILGVDLRGKTSTELLDAMILIPKTMLPNGMIDLVKIRDDVDGGTFFGEDKLQQDYLGYREQCKRREAKFQPRVDAITNQLIAEAAALDSPEAACRRLAQLSQREMLEYSITDEMIDANVFGTEAAWRIEQARSFLEAGDIDRAKVVTATAQTLAHSSSCPGGASSAGAETTNDSDSGESGSEKLKDCEFTSKKCPVCGEANAKTKVENGKYYHMKNGKKVCSS